MKRRADGLYQKKVTINGKQKIVYGKTQKEVNDKAYQLKTAGIQQLHNFKQLADEMLDEKEKTVSATTIKRYRETLRHLSDLFNRNIEDLTIHDLKSLINEKYAEGLSKSSLIKIRNLYSLIAKFAIEKGLHITNYTSSITIPQNAPQAERTALTYDEINIINQHVTDEFGLYPFTMLYTGLRRGELCALTWDAVDFDKKAIAVVQSIEYIHNRPVLKSPKTKAGVRMIPILDNLYPHLLNAYKSKNSDDVYVFGGPAPYSDTMMKRRWKKYISSVGLTITQHQLRHTYATLLYRAGIDAKTAQNFLGHADIQTTLNIYTHIDHEVNAAAANQLNSFLSK